MSVSLLMSVVLLGLIASPHCAGMCGCAFARPWLQISESGFYLGRVAAYVLLGALAGGVSFGLSSSSEPGMLIFKALNGMLHAVLLFVGFIYVVRAKPVVPAQVYSRVQFILPGKSLSRPFTQGVRGGLLWLFMPCAVLYAALALAYLSASVWQGALLMGVFGLISSGSIAVALQLQAVLKGRVSEGAMIRANGVLILFSLAMMLGREMGWIPTPAVLESLGLCL